MTLWGRWNQRLWVFGLGLFAFGTMAATTVPSNAYAEGSERKAFSGPLFELLPGGEIVGDGATEVKLYFLALDETGKPLEGVNGRLTVPGGEVSRLETAGSGTVVATWTPPNVDSIQNMKIGFRGKAEETTGFERSWQVSVHPALDQEVQIEVNPNPIVLGQDTSATLTIQLSGGSKLAAAETDIAVLSSSGRIANTTGLGDGRYSALFSSPRKQFPHLALITVADRRNPSGTFGHYVLPLVGKADFPVVGIPNSRILIKIGDRDFGPVQADSAGRARVPIIVEPGGQIATVISVLGDKRTEEPLDLQIPPSPRIQFFPMHSGIPADVGTTVEVRAFVATPMGEGDQRAKVSFATTAGEISRAVHEGDGVYMASFKPPYSNSDAKATIQVSVEDPRGPQSDSLTVDLIAARPAQLTLTAEPDSLSKEAVAFKVFSKVMGADGVGVSSREMAFVASGAEVNGNTKDLGNGDYQTQFSTSTAGPVELVATVRSSPSGNPLSRVLVFPFRDRVISDGMSSTMLTVLTVDDFGYPVGGMPVDFKLVQGDGSIPSSATTDPNGVVQVYYTAGRRPGLSRIEVSSGDHVGATSILQAPATVSMAGRLPVSASQETENFYAAWANVISGARLEREGMVGAVIAASSDASGGAVGPIAKLAVTSEPASLVPGGKVTLNIQAQDGEGRGASGKSVEVIASAGVVGAVQDLGGGNYQTSLTVPVGVAGEVKISVVSPESNVSGFLKVPITGGSSWQDVASTPTGEQAAEPEKEEEPKEEKEKEEKKEREPRVAGEYPWLRLDAGVITGRYHYQQEANAESGPLYAKSITVGGTVSDPGGTVGFGLNSRMWHPKLDFIGLDVGFETWRWAVELPEFDNPIADWINDFELSALGRYPFAVGEHQMHIGGKLGVNTNDFIIFRQGSEKGRSVYSFEPLLVTSMIAGLELGAEVGPVFGRAGMTLGPGDFSGIFSTAMNAQVGYELLDQLYLQVGGHLLTRRTVIYLIPDDGGGQLEVGNIVDSTPRISIAIGYQK